MANDRVIITHCGLENSRISVEKMASKDLLLMKHANLLVEELLQKDIEVWETFDNVVITEEGYYLALYEKDLVLSEKEKRAKPKS
jgi:hypothetical protein